MGCIEPKSLMQNKVIKSSYVTEVTETKNIVNPKPSKNNVDISLLKNSNKVNKETKITQDIKRISLKQNSDKPTSFTLNNEVLTVGKYLEANQKSTKQIEINNIKQDSHKEQEIKLESAQLVPVLRKSSKGNKLSDIPNKANKIEIINITSSIESLHPFWLEKDKTYTFTLNVSVMIDSDIISQ